MRATVRFRVPTVVVPMAAAVSVGALDLLLAARDWPLLGVALIDETAHLLTAWLAVSALLRPPTRRSLLPWVLGGAVLLDLDHVPLYLGLDVTAGSGGRPVTHSLAMLVVLIGLACAVRRFRLPLAGLAAGVATQLWRDLSTGPGVPLVWPVLPDSVRLPWSVLGVSLVVLAGAATWRSVAERRASRSGLPWPPGTGPTADERRHTPSP